MKIKVEVVELENLTERLAAGVLSLIWRISEDAGVCPICMMECMYDMMLHAHEEGAIHHIDTERDTMGEPPVKTHQ